jgi:hypothetical protein
MQVLGLFQKRIDGDDSLLELARRKYAERGMGAEIYADHPGLLQQLLAFAPSDRPVTVHLPRWFDVASTEHAEFLKPLLMVQRDGLVGYVVHDSQDVQRQPDRVEQGLARLQGIMESSAPDRMLFYEYAAGVDPDAYCELLLHCRDLGNISACIDIGHIGIRTIRQAWRKQGKEVDACSLRPETPGLEQLMPDLQKAVSTALPAVLKVIKQLAEIAKPLHFHFHDGHPLSSLSRFGVSDHLGFLRTIDLPFNYTDNSGDSPVDRHQVAMMYGPEGLRKIIDCCQTRLQGHFTLTIEIHDQPGRHALGKYADIFSHWRNLENAEVMNFWLEEILDNETLLHRCGGAQT